MSVFNGWNSVVDTNEEKSVQANVTYKVAGAVLRLVCILAASRRSRGAEEGPAWRHHFDAIAQIDPTSWLSVAGQGDYGWENNRNRQG